TAVLLGLILRPDSGAIFRRYRRKWRAFARYDVAQRGVPVEIARWHMFDIATAAFAVGRPWIVAQLMGRTARDHFLDSWRGNKPQLPLQPHMAWDATDRSRAWLRRLCGDPDFDYAKPDESRPFTFIPDALCYYAAYARRDSTFVERVAAGGRTTDDRL